MGIVPTAVGARFACADAVVFTVTGKEWIANNPPGSVAFNVTVDFPAATAVMLTCAPDTLTVANPVLEELAV